MLLRSQILVLATSLLAAQSPVCANEEMATLTCPDDSANTEYKITSVRFEEGGSRRSGVNRFFYGCLKYERSRRSGRWIPRTQLDLSIETTEFPE